MNRQKILISLIVGVAVVALGTFCILNKCTSKDEEMPVETTSSLQDIIDEKVEFTTKTESVQFDSLEEMVRFAQEQNTIKSKEEGIKFVNDFLMSSSLNKPELIIGCYLPDMRQEVIANELLPVYDDSGLFDYRISNIDVLCDKEDEFTSYTAKYTLTMIDKETNEDYYIIERKDKFELSKDMGNIYINKYSRQVSDSKKL